MTCKTAIRMLALSFATAFVLACGNPADNKPEARVGQAVAPPSAPTPPPVAEERLVVSPKSTFGFTGSKVTGSHEGGFRGVTGHVALVGGDPSRSHVEVAIDTTTLWSDNERLTGHLKSPDFFDVERFPTARFTSTSIARGAAGYDVTGNLELHGVTRSITFPATIDVQPGTVTAKAEFVIRRFDFDIRYAGKADDLIRDEVVIRLDLLAEKNA